MIVTNQDMPMEESPGESPRFQAGQLVRHKRYGYRGVIVDYDLKCKASQEWYLSNTTQPSRKQPWYHVLVHGTGGMTYPAQENLIEDTSNVPIDHPLLSQYFSDFLVDGRYIRNNRSWSV